MICAMAAYRAPLVVGLMGTQVMPCIVGVTAPLAKVGSTTSILSLPVRSLSVTCLLMNWKFDPFPPGNAPLQRMYSASSMSTPQPFLAFV